MTNNQLWTDVVGVLILILVSGYFLFRMDGAETIIDTLKYGFCFLTTTIHLVSLMNRGAHK